ncbi:hypothetical protein ACEWY4_027156 [Coilia grayii]|uniref:MRN complex-interacting protein N-terminal domain-containing protein n=1 Tax=Coilia grayii TaxID=363190 RepID=A0ABD1IS66_9TELE
MVQEFHVLRCFACETFQVQQVKKAKKWNCKMCGEKQSVIKEYGRGTGADCRRHVQKLNGLRGQLLEEENESAWSRWEEDEVPEFNHEDETLFCKPQQVVGESRWSKYVETAVPLGGDEEEEENFYTECKRFSSERNVRSRKRGGRGRSGVGGYGDPEEEEDQVQETGSWRHDRGPLKRRADTRPVHPAVTREDCTFSTPSSHSNTLTPSAASQAPPSGHPSRNFHAYQHRPSVSSESSASRPTGPATRKPLIDAPINKGTDVSSSQPVPKVGQPESKSSKWAKFLTVPSMEDQEEREEDDGAAHCSDPDEGSDAPWSEAYHNPAPANFRAQHEKTSCSSGRFGAMPSLSKASGVADKVNSAAACFGFVSAANQIPSPTFTAQPIGQERPVHQQPQPFKRPCPGLAGTSLFQTDEDFDITF